jgi:hypothetical protein
LNPRSQDRHSSALPLSYNLWPKKFSKLFVRIKFLVEIRSTKFILTLILFLGSRLISLHTLSRRNISFQNDAMTSPVTTIFFSSKILTLPTQSSCVINHFTVVINTVIGPFLGLQSRTILALPTNIRQG